MGGAGQVEVAGAGDPLSRPPGRFNRITFRAFWLLFHCFARLWFRLRVENLPRLPGAYVLAPNHVSLLDPLLVGAASRRRVIFLMTEVIHRSPWLGWFYRWNRAIPLAARGGNRDRLRAARAVLQQGRVVGIFPEGGISRDGGLLLGNPGAVALVLQEGVAVVPVAVIGADRALPPGAVFPRPVRITIRFGDPIPPAALEAVGSGRKDRLQAATRLIMDRIAGLCGGRSREAELEAWRGGSAGPV